MAGQGLEHVTPGRVSERTENCLDAHPPVAQDSARLRREDISSSQPPEFDSMLWALRSSVVSSRAKPLSITETRTPSLIGVTVNSIRVVCPGCRSGVAEQPYSLGH
jgi:hypothetical protein